jgi:hypothetical protein
MEYLNKVRLELQIYASLKNSQQKETIQSCSNLQQFLPDQSHPAYKDQKNHFLKLVAKVSGGHQFTLQDVELLIVYLAYCIPKLQDRLVEYNQYAQMTDPPSVILVVGDQSYSWQHMAVCHVAFMKRTQDALNCLYGIRSTMQNVESGVAYAKNGSDRVRPFSKAIDRLAERLGVQHER